ncbi:MAG TPA: GNAT family N-acetyltransferase [Candidatus Limnocylindrales bacterium]|nr:GNAT family N-acetyltransferase [Candidatus Limnocylindrales bacterium]
MTAPFVRRGGRRRPPPPSIRRATVDDLVACTHVWRDALADYLARLNQPTVAGDLDPVRRLLAHLLATDPTTFWVATRPASGGADPGEARGANDERVVGFASANVRGQAWFLAMLFVEPHEQARGLGAALLERSLPEGRHPWRDGEIDVDDDGASATQWTFGTATDSAQPISNALYARLGLVPRVPVLHLVGVPTRPAALPALPPEIDAVAFDALPFGAPGGDRPPVVARAVDAIDRELLGYEHPEDHGYLRRERRIGVLYRERDGTPVAYGYTSRVGRLGPVAVRRAGLMPAVLGHLLGVVRPAGAFSVWVPGAAAPTIAGLLGAGFRLEAFPALHCWDRPSVDVSRYIPITLALL